MPSRFRLQKKKKRRKLRRALQLLAAAAAGALTAYWGALWLNNSQHPPEEPASDIHPDIHSSAPEEESRTGYVLVTSSPAGASVYDADGNYLDETPYGPIELPSGSPVAYTIKKSGFADKEEAGTVKGGATLALGGVLKEYHPPTDSQPWKDTEGVTYLPAETRHVAQGPLTAALFNKFLKEDRQKGNFQMKREQTEPEHPEKDVALLTQDGITAYLAWLNKKCEREGLLGKEFSINADPVPQASGSTENHNAYVLNVTRVFQVPITVTTNPPGASVFSITGSSDVPPLKNTSTRFPTSLKSNCRGTPPCVAGGWIRRTYTFPCSWNRTSLSFLARPGPTAWASNWSLWEEMLWS